MFCTEEVEAQFFHPFHPLFQENLIFFDLSNKISTTFGPEIENVELVSDSALIEVEELQGPKIKNIMVK